MCVCECVLYLETAIRFAKSQNKSLARSHLCSGAALKQNQLTKKKNNEKQLKKGSCFEWDHALIFLGKFSLIRMLHYPSFLASNRSTQFSAAFISRLHNIERSTNQTKLK